MEVARPTYLDFAKFVKKLENSIRMNTNRRKRKEEDQRSIDERDKKMTGKEKGDDMEYT